MQRATHGIPVNRDKPRFDAAFLEVKRRQLTELRQTLLRTRDSQTSEETDLNAASSDAHEFEDDAQRLASVELQGELLARGEARLADIERALKKIDDGSYGLSDASGRAIPLERLEAVPEAILTLEEQSSRDRVG